MIQRRFSISTVLVTGLLLAFTGFGLGYNYPQLEAYVRDRWFDQATPTVPDNLDYTSVEDLYDQLRRNYAGELDSAKLIEGAMRGLVAAAGDPYTEYLTPAAAAELQSDLAGTFSGIGAEIAVKNEQLVIVAPLAGSPAEQAGLRAGDQIRAIDGEDTRGISVEAAVSQIRGEAGSLVTLTIVRGRLPAKDYKIKRADIEVPAVKSQLLAGSVGYVELLRFGDGSDEEFLTTVNDLKSQGATKLILDLRNNPGGLLSSAVAIADEFLDVGKTIVEERKDGSVLQTFRATAGGSAVGLPLVVLVNEGSASASEIIAGAVQDNQVAKLVGEQTFGKGSVQELVELDGRAYLKVTIARWYTPNGRNISEEGIAPDIKVELTEADFNASRDPQLNRALQLLR
ncbi:S41 family peptidase [Candidatus Microgenomates bacterium]|nr:S41 family peptidase [Candidatus Microgenomates bacterium]